MKNEPNNSQLDKQDEASELAHVPAWEGQEFLSEFLLIMEEKGFKDSFLKDEENDYSNE